MSDFWEGRRKDDGSLTDDMPLGVQAPGAVLPWLATQLRNPETAFNWLDFLSRFHDAPWLPPGTWPGQWTQPFDKNWMKLGESELSWLDIWVFFCCARRVSLVRGRQGPDGVSDLTEVFEASAARFGVRWQTGHPVYPQFGDDVGLSEC